MGKITDMIDRLKRATAPEQEKAILSIIDQNKSYVVDLNTSQLFAGKDNQGQLLKPPYKLEKYAEFKKTLNPAGVVDLRLTGQFYNSFYADASKFPVRVFATDEKTSELGGKYGSDIFNLTTGSKADLADHLRSQIVDDYYKREVFNI